MPERCLLVITGACALGGGIASANRLVIHALADEGYEIDVFALSEDNATADYAHIRGIRQRGFRNRKVQFVLAVWKALLTQSYDFVFCDHVNLAYALALPARFGLSPEIMLRLNGIEVFAPLPDFEGRTGLLTADYLQAISQFTKESVLSQFPDLNINVIDLALDPVRSSKVAQQNKTLALETMQAVNGTGKTLNDRVLLHVGRMSKLEQYKGQDKLIETMPVLLEKHPDVQLVLVGRGDDRERLLQLACGFPPHVQEAIFMPGFVPDDILEQLYQQCFAFVMPGRGEGFGIVYLEAMSYSKACIGSRVDASANIIHHEETGLLVDNPESSESVAKTVLQLLDNPESAKRMGQAGYDTLCSNYLYPHFRHRFIDHLQQSGILRK